MKKLKHYKPLFTLKEYFKKVLTFKGYNIFDTDHSVVRYKERVGDDISLYEDLLKKGIDWIIDNKKTKVEDRYVWYSKEKGFGIQIHWRKDRKMNTFAGFSATTLSDNEMKVLTQNDKKIFLENIQKQGYSLKEAKDIVDKGYARYEFDKGLKEEMDLIFYDMFVDGGPEVYKTFELIEL